LSHKSKLLLAAMKTAVLICMFAALLMTTEAQWYWGDYYGWGYPSYYGLGYYGGYGWGWPYGWYGWGKQKREISTDDMEAQQAGLHEILKRAAKANAENQ